MTAMSEERTITTVDEAIRELAGAPDGVLPVDAMTWALQHWDEAGPRFVELLERCAGGSVWSEGMEDALFFIFHLLAEKQETRAFPALCRLSRDSEAVELIVGDAITETLTQILISTFDGNAALLKAVIEDAAADEFVREAAFQALAWHCRAGAISDEEMRAYLLHLHEQTQPGENMVWLGWVNAVSSLGFQDLADKAERLVDEFFLHIMDVGDFRDDLRQTLADPDRMVRFTANHIGPFVDAIGTLSTWHGFSEEYREQLARGEESDDGIGDLDDPLVPRGWPSIAFGEPAINPARDVGRNDPCPCGSGKKYKKCCLGKDAA
ncbi:DUF1186 domain-containing protein [Mycobacterium sp. KBS0706]|uniref:DUF1186 domain-containing protein n=1 Tax=Mycobacterium sp. KBS0706 TaxID=2578109 RepID=UPI00110FC058|nr:DUF1186 domain-containing protein [Mycobacterium sp. KBS0706]TSD89190.1 DUF1186 domain-containing protein [Mycobacterium sp. KBS0706]